MRAIETEEVPQGQGEVQKPEREKYSGRKLETKVVRQKWNARCSGTSFPAGTLIGCPIDSRFAALTIMQPGAAKALTLTESATVVTS